MKTCWSCGEEKPITDYYRDRKSPDGRQATCKECQYDLRKMRQHRDLNELLQSWGLA